MLQNAVEQPPKFVGRWVGSFVINVFIVVWVLVVGFGFGGWASMVNFVHQIDTFGLFTKCYQCPPSSLPTMPPHQLNATAAAPSPLHHHWAAFNFKLFAWIDECMMHLHVLWWSTWSVTSCIYYVFGCVVN